VSTVQAGIAHPKPLPVLNSDFCELAGTLNAEELAVVKQVRAFMERKVAPIINRYWADDAFPFELACILPRSDPPLAGSSRSRP
jgi:hypothetical protein